MRIKKTTAQIIGEYAVTVALIVGVLTAMTIFIRRAMQGRVHDAAHFMGDYVRDASRTIPVSIPGQPVSYIQPPDQYEPYYGSTEADVATDTTEEVKLLPGGGGRDFEKTFSSTTESATTSIQLPPSEAR